MKKTQCYFTVSCTLIKPESIIQESKYGTREDGTASVMETQADA